MPESDPLEALREQIRAATDAAERLVRDTARRPAQPEPPPPQRSPGGVPSSGWAKPAAEEETAAEIQALAHLVGSLREVLPAEIQEQLTEVVRQLLVLLRALIDFALSRMEQATPGHRPSPEVEDIPIS